MREYQKRRMTNQFLVTSLNAAIVLQLILSPLVLSQSVNPSAQKQYLPQCEEAFIMNDLNGYELLNNIGINHIIGRNVRDFQRLLSPVLDTDLLPILTLGILLVDTLTYLKKKRQCIPILATSLGGHAPPYIAVF